MTTDVAVVSAADAQFFDLLQGMVRSLRDKPEGRDLALYVFDIGMTETQRRWLLLQGARLHIPSGETYRDDLPSYLRAFLSRCRIPELFPGHEVYVWLDADAWVQSWDAFAAYVAGALRTGFAITPETDPAYDRGTVLAVHQASFAMFGPQCVERLRKTGPLNGASWSTPISTRQTGKRCCSSSTRRRCASSAPETILVPPSCRRPATGSSISRCR
jgi:hypothetical protein